MPKTALRSTAAVALMSTKLLSSQAWAETVLTIGMTAADIPRTSGQPDQGFEGNRFTGIPMYDALTHWDLSSETEPSVIIPGLATSWAVDPDDTTKWTFTLREGVTFHDGRPSRQSPWSGTCKRSWTRPRPISRLTRSAPRNRGCPRWSPPARSTT